MKVEQFTPFSAIREETLLLLVDTFYGLATRNSHFKPNSTIDTIMNPGDGFE